MSSGAPQCQIYLSIDINDSTRERLAGVFALRPLASVLLVNEVNSRASPSSLKPAIEFIQAKGVAALIADDAALARALRADGVHLGPGADLMARYEEARSILGAGAIVGVDAGGSRHLAMEAGEAGADYIAFSDVQISTDDPADSGDASEATPADDDDLLQSDAASANKRMSKAELVSWWSDIFEVPCVALDGKDVDELRALINCGADFIGVAVKSGRPIAEAAALIESLLDRPAGKSGGA